MKKSNEPQVDVVVEARELLKIDLPDSAHSIEHALWADAIERQHESPFWGSSRKIAEAYARAPELLRQLCDEVERQRTALIKLRDSTSDMWACSFAGKVLKGIAIDDALNHAEKYNHD